MTEEDEKVEVATPESEVILTPGAMLQRAREAKGLDIRAAADQLRMSRVKLIALEADAFEEFQGETFIRGYIKAYCRILDLDEAQAIARYEAYIAATAQVGLLIEPRETRIRGRGLYSEPSYKPFVVALVILVAGLVALAVYFVNFTPENEQVSAPSAIENSTSDVIPAPQLSLPSEVLSGHEESPALGAEDVAPAVDVPSVATAPVVSTSVSVAPVKVAPLLDSLRIVFTQECWLEVSDVKGDVLATELKEAGSEIVLQGRAPFNVMLGNARAATVFLNGDKVDSNPLNTNRALRFTVDKP